MCWIEEWEQARKQNRFMAQDKWHWRALRGGRGVSSGCGGGSGSSSSSGGGGDNVRVVVVSQSPSGTVFTSRLCCRAGGKTKFNWGPKSQSVAAAFWFYKLSALPCPWMSIEEEEEEESHQLALLTRPQETRFRHTAASAAAAAPRLQRLPLRIKSSRALSHVLLCSRTPQCPAIPPPPQLHRTPSSAAQRATGTVQSPAQAVGPW